MHYAFMQTDRTDHLLVDGKKKKVQRRVERCSSQNKEYHLLLSWSRHGEERLEAEYNNTHTHTITNTAKRRECTNRKQRIK